MSEPVHINLGMDPDQWDAAMAAGRATRGWKGMPASAEPRFHAHPALGIHGHSHGHTTEDARRPHVHHPEIGWHGDPIFVVVPSQAPEEGPIRVLGAESTGYIPTLAEYAAVIEAMDARMEDAIPEHLERAYTDAMRRAALARAAAAMRAAIEDES